MMNDEDWDALHPPIRAGAAFEEILRDLIAELRAISYETDSPWTVAYSAVDRAEARLREVQGE